MNQINPDRLAGVVAGVFLVKAVNSITAFVSIVALIGFPTTEVLAFFTGSTPPAIGAFVWSVLGSAYYSGRKNRSVDILSIALLLLGVIISIVAVFMVWNGGSSSLHGKIRYSSIIDNVAKIIVNLLMIWCIAVIMKADKTPVDPMQILDRPIN